MIAQTILRQMGGINRISAMIRAYDILDLGNGVQFKFKGGQNANCIIVKLNDLDLYDVEYYKITKKAGIPRAKLVKTENMIYADQLKKSFETVTGLYLSL